MEGPRRWSGLLHTLVPAATLAAVLGAVVVVWAMSAEAIEERGASAEAAELRFAALTVSNADALHAITGRIESPDLPSAVARLQADHDAALHSLPPRQRARADDLLEEITGCGLLLTGPGTADHPPPHGHEELQKVLAAAAANASARAATAEEHARTSVAGALIVMLLAGWFLMRSRIRTRRDRADAAGEAEVRRRLETLLNDSPDIIMVIAPEGSITYRSRSVDRLLGSEAGRDIGDVLVCVGADDRDRLADHVNTEGAKGLPAIFRMTTADGEERDFDVRVSDLLDDALVNGHLVTARDVTNELKLRDDLERQAILDELTGLPNRRALEPALRDAQARLEASGEVAALLILDLDGFKATNDTFGHLAGDRLLQQAAGRLSATVRSDETLLRLGGDEFALVIPSTVSAGDVSAAAERLLAALHAPFAVGPEQARLRTSIGAAITSGPIDPESLLRRADIAMYEAKRAGGDAVVVSTDGMEAHAVAGAPVSRSRREADFDRELSAALQPIADSH